MSNEKFKKKVERYKKLGDEARLIIDDFNKASVKLQKLYQNNVVPHVGYAEGPYGSGGIHYIYCEESLEKEARECEMTLDEFLESLEEEEIRFELDEYDHLDQWQNSSTAGC